MSGYSFENLSPDDFEQLVGDLISKQLGIRLQAFTTGRDRGIDLRYAADHLSTLIVQCKHYARSGYSKLASNLTNTELGKLRKLNPSKYVLVTSVGLSPDNVDELLELLSPYCTSPHDIIGRDDLNAMLRMHPEIERAHFKLWLSSSHVLSRVLHNGVFVQSAIERERMRKRIQLYVKTDAVAKAFTLLENGHCCLITGLPGIGKSTLAEILLLRYLMDDWELVRATQSVTEILEVYDQSPSAKQVFYYDDFLGQISLGDKLAKNEDKTLVDLINTVSESSNKRLILTTREYILNQARESHELLARTSLSPVEYVLQMSSFSPIDKARILANHLYFGGASHDHVTALLHERRHREIISHRNYNPRLIEAMTSARRLDTIAPNKYYDAILHALDHPGRLWTHAFWKQIHDRSRDVLLCLATLGAEVLLPDLEAVFRSLQNSRQPPIDAVQLTGRFHGALQELDGSFTLTHRYGSDVTIELSNPSILDFLNDVLQVSPALLCELLNAACYFEQPTRVFALLSDRKADVRIDDRGADVLETLTKACIRTFDQQSARVMKAYSNKVGRHATDDFERLAITLQMYQKHRSRDMHEFVVDRAETLLSGIRVRRPSLETVGEVMNGIDATDLRTHSSRRRWLSIVNDYVASGCEEFDDLSAAANWLLEEATEVTDKQLDTFHDVANELVVDRCDYLRTDAKSAADINEFEDAVEYLQAMGLSMHVDMEQLEEIRRRFYEAEEAAAEAMSGGGYWAHGRDSSEAEVDGVFDALRDTIDEE